MRAHTKKEARKYSHLHLQVKTGRTNWYQPVGKGFRTSGFRACRSPSPCRKPRAWDSICLYIKPYKPKTLDSVQHLFRLRKATPSFGIGHGGWSRNPSIPPLGAHTHTHVGILKGFRQFSVQKEVHLWVLLERHMLGLVQRPFASMIIKGAESKGRIFASDWMRMKVM